MIDRKPQSRQRSNDTSSNPSMSTSSLSESSKSSSALPPPTANHTRQNSLRHVFTLQRISEYKLNHHCSTFLWIHGSRRAPELLVASFTFSNAQLKPCHQRARESRTGTNRENDECKIGIRQNTLSGAVTFPGYSLTGAGKC